MIISYNGLLPKVSTMPDIFPNSTHSDSCTVIVRSSIGGRSSIPSSPFALMWPEGALSSHVSKNSWISSSFVISIVCAGMLPMHSTSESSESVSDLKMKWFLLSYYNYKSTDE